MSKNINKKPVADPFSEMQSFENRIRGQKEANLKREREKEEKKIYSQHMKEERSKHFQTLISEENAMPSGKAAKFCTLTALGALALAAAVLLILFNIRFYLPSSQGEFIANFNRISTVDSYSFLFENYPQTAEYSISADKSLPDATAPLYFNDGNFYLYFETRDDKIVSVTAGAVHGYAGFNATTGTFADETSEIEYKAFLMRVFAGMDSRFITDYEECSDIIDRLQSRSSYETFDYTYEDTYIMTYDFTSSLYLHIEPVRTAIAVWPESEEIR